MKNKFFTFAFSVIISICFADDSRSYSAKYDSKILSGIPMSSSAGDQYGFSVSNIGDFNNDGFDDIVIGAPYNDDRDVDAGKAYIILGGNNIDYIPDAVLNGSASGSTYENFGFCVSGAGDVNNDNYDDIAISAPYFGTGTGRVFIYLGGPTIDTTADLIITGQSENLSFGYSVSGAGDINGDGFDDVIAGATTYSTSTGRAYIFLGGSTMNNGIDLTMTGIGSFNELGKSVSGAGDVNNDGYDDFIIGSPGNSSGNGRANIYFGGSTLNNVADVIVTGQGSGGYFGTSVSCAGDVNNDTYDDVIIGAYGLNSNNGRIYIYYGGMAMNNVADVTVSGNTGSDFGYSVSDAGDVNNDGYDDVIAGAPSAGPGMMFVYQGGISMDTIPDKTASGEFTGDKFGYSVSSAGDINNDLLPDQVAGAIDFNLSGGNIYVYLQTDTSFIITRLIPEGFYNESNQLNISDTVTVYLHSVISPYIAVDSSKALINYLNFEGVFYFPNTPTGNYYMRIKHRNLLETWSRINGISFTVNSVMNYDFTNSATSAYGNNLKQISTSPLHYALYSGDVNQDLLIDLSDVLQIFNDANDFTTGYEVTDLTGDNVTDLNDVLLAFNNAVGFVAVIKP